MNACSRELISPLYRLRAAATEVGAAASQYPGSSTRYPQPLADAIFGRKLLALLGRRRLASPIGR